MITGGTRGTWRSLNLGRSGRPPRAPTRPAGQALVPREGRPPRRRGPEDSRTRQRNLGETEPRLAWGAFERLQLTIGTPLRIGEDNANNGNGDVELEGLWKLMGARRHAWWPGAG